MGRDITLGAYYVIYLPASRFPVRPPPSKNHTDDSLSEGTVLDKSVIRLFRVARFSDKPLTEQELSVYFPHTKNHTYIISKNEARGDSRTLNPL